MVITTPCRWIGVLVCLFSFTTAVVAQPPQEVRQRRRAFIEDLLKTLVESQTETENVVHKHGHIRPNLPTDRTIPVSKQMQRARQQLATLSESSGRLVYALQHEQQYLPQIGPLLGDCVQIKATSDVLLVRANQYPNVEVLVDDFRKLNHHWRILKHRLKQVRKLNKACSDQIALVDKCNANLCGIFEVEPQFDRREMVSLTSTYTANIQHLMKDIHVDLRNQPQGRELLLECQNLYTLCNQTGRLARTGSYDDLVANYRKCERQWRRLSRKLLNCNSDRVMQHVIAIEETGKHCHEQLWIPVEIDYGFLKDVITSVDANTHVSLANITAVDLLQCDKPCQAIEVLREFQDGCHDTIASLEGSPALEELSWDFRSLDVTWNNMSSLCRQFPSPELQTHLDTIESMMNMTRQYLGDAPVIANPEDLRRDGTAISSVAIPNTSDRGSSPI